MSRLDLPQIGLGTSGNDEFEECAETVRAALDVGYRHVDTAQMYDNEAAVGEGIRRSDVDREAVTIATKIHPDNLAYEDVLKTAEESLDRLGVDAVDLLYVHWPISAYDPSETLQAFDELVEEGVVDHVGVSNFSPSLVEEAQQHLEAPIVANQVECHPLLPQQTLRAHAHEHGYELVGYSPLGQGELLEEPLLSEIAAEYDATPAQIALSWAIARGVTPIPKGRGDHLRENLASVGLDLRAADVARIDELDQRTRFVDPDAAPWNEGS
ncbi:Aldo/keto reductase, related to diketogulonate reductase [Halalkaliarchaeum sp. AArc-CO]|uniref:aldo/keto reductase n=1 Tax=unclassified Halalkaliarchaeum TaxID=2678344 RepID=UPI00217E4C8B|nr:MULTISPECIES: aldo/keto reductase [unclassified Halalkaliarchaeum]MDR5672984.1 aldo/keto reductase [Halalkaliarchaeum sp. AArc-GB]UWG50326.1 Aldo/keto reductase, related to diketogulonate reductase [Halalkaliarchaeum sp. AArc-CO]